MEDIDLLEGLTAAGLNPIEVALLNVQNCIRKACE